MKRLIFIVLVVCFGLSSCDTEPVPEKLPLSVKANLNLLLKDAQFVMYMNFKSMRATEFWQNNLSDSILNSEQTFGSILNLFGKATGVTISNGLDELYYANSWFGENSIVLKGVFNRNKIEEYIISDTTFTKIKHSDGTTIYKHIDDNLFFCLKDNVTLCASNYRSQLDRMIAVKDTSATGLRENVPVMNAIENTIYKKDLWMVSTEKMFIRGVFLNFLGTGAPPQPGGETEGESENPVESLTEGLEIDKIYEKVNSIAFSINMDKELNIIAQGECVDEEAASSIRKVISGLLTFSRVGTAFSSSEEKSATEEIINSMEVNSYGNNVYLDIDVSNENISSFRNKKFIEDPPKEENLP